MARVQLRAATIYLVGGLLLGVAMAASSDFTLKGVHAHMHLLGWVTLAISGLVYAMMPALSASRLARWHVVLHNLGLPVMMFALAAYLSGVAAAEPGIALGAILSTLGLCAFTLALWRSL
ncbi:cytochrome-c oxidase [Histidinibacterium lentulum]|uniref:Cytochrome-c oxidase n=1 Tax=Histidinibacterium lentulum TaxID=2480588 RepID=A0A3N2R1R1_9RHOB|nr:cytochrome-c oxidase [Histidinibacterium lentulum]